LVICFIVRSRFASYAADFELGARLNTDLYFVIPGKISTLTGGYEYDRQLMAALQGMGTRVHHIELSDRFPDPDIEAMSHAAALMAAIPDGAVVLADGLAWGTMDTIAQSEYERLTIIALCHHPLAFESGLTTAQQVALFRSEKTALELSAAVVVTSQATADLLVKAYGIPAAKVTVALPGTQKQQFAACQGNPPILLTVATLTQRKAHDVLIDALSRITNLPWAARFVGGDKFDSAWAAHLRKITDALGLNERISFTGSVADLTPEYMNADLFVLPSRFEGYGMVFAEALAFGLPIIAARAGAVPDVVPASAGVLVNADDATALALALHQVLSDKQRHHQLRLGAQIAAKALPAWQDTAEILHTLLMKLLTRP
jgi:glycosyltransferase involved in cell wall biosynthesis